MTKSPYSGRPESSWLGITQRLVNSQPLKRGTLLEAAVAAWTTLWQTTLGSGQTSVRLSELQVPATIVGYFFEILLTRELERHNPTLWRGSRSKDEKDLVYLPDQSCSIEIKTSGQAGFKIYGNRSYRQKSANELLIKKEKSGFYITANFFQTTLTLLRFGWIDAEDWEPQKAQTGQMAGLKQAVYEHKLLPLPGPYRQQAPVILLSGAGPRVVGEFASLGIRTIGDLLAYRKPLPSRLDRVKQLNQRFLAGCLDQSIREQP